MQMQSKQLAKLRLKATIAVPIELWMVGFSPCLACPFFGTTPSQSPLLPDAIAELLRAKQRAGRRPDTIRNLRFYLRRFSEHHPGITVAEITPQMLSDWLDREPSAWSRQSGLNRISSLCSFAFRRGWLPNNPCARVERMTVDLKPPRILTVGEASALLRAADPKVRPWITLGLFVGLRPSEALRMDWEAVRLGGERPHVVVDAAASKVRRRRIVVLKPAAVAWLALDKRNAGPVVSSYTSIRKFRRRAAGASGLCWTQDVLRHTNASFRIAAGDHVHAVADELGHSTRVLLTHYRELVTREDALSFWALRPDSAIASVRTL